MTTAFVNGTRRAPHAIVTHRSSAHLQSIASMVSLDTLRSLDAIAKKRQTTKAEIIRNLVTNFVNSESS